MPIATTTARMPYPGLTPCPACGQLECLCRPRFFAGQLLTGRGPQSSRPLHRREEQAAQPLSARLGCSVRAGGPLPSLRGLRYRYSRVCPEPVRR